MYTCQCIHTEIKEQPGKGPVSIYPVGPEDKREVFSSLYHLVSPKDNRKVLSQGQQEGFVSIILWVPRTTGRLCLYHHEGPKDNRNVLSCRSQRGNSGYQAWPCILPP